MTITVSTDGSALGNPNGPMGWAWADHEAGAGTKGVAGHGHPGDCDAGGATNGTNQIGELCAVLEALRAHPGAEPLIIETDSQYAINCSTKWVHGWKRNGWRNSQKKPVKNAALIKAIDAELTAREGSVKFVWVKGHAGNAGNEKVDELARTYAGDCRTGARDGYLPREGWESLLASEYSRGTTVPEDARMLMDGRITSAEYHLGRGETTGGTGDVVSDGAAGRRGASSTTVKATGGATRGTAGAAKTKTTAGGPGGATTTRRTSSSTVATEATARAQEQPMSSAQDSTSEPDHPTIGRRAVPAGQQAPAARVEQSAQAGVQSASPAAPATPTAASTVPAASSPAAPVSPAAPATPNTMSTVRATGRLTVSPAPSTARAFRGAAVRVRATIEVDAIIAPDGTMEIDAPMTFDRNDVHRV